MPQKQRADPATRYEPYCMLHAVLGRAFLFFGFCSFMCHSSFALVFALVFALTFQQNLDTFVFAGPR
jgi:hypothetical protein